MSGDNPRFDAPLPDLWDDAHAAALDEPGLLLYRSNLLGSDLRITNFGGGNTSAKLDSADPLTGAPTKVLWVKGSGGDIGSMKLDGFSTLYLDKLLGLRSVYRGLAHEDEMVALYNHCTFNLNPRATSIDTTLHGFVPHAHVDHVHADAVIAIAASENAEALTHEIYGGELGFLPWQRPGFDLGLKLGAMAEANPHYKGVVLGGHGLFTWGPTSKDCYETTLAMINKAAQWLGANTPGVAFGGPRFEALSRTERRDVAARLLPAIRKRISAGERKIGHFTDAPAVMEFVNSRDLKALAALGTSCPDHFLRTKIRPLVLPFDPTARNLDAVVASLDKDLADYRADYAAYYRTLQAPGFAADARSQRGHLSRARRRHAVLRQGQGDRPHRRGVLRQRDQRHARVRGRQPLCRARGAGGVRYRILAARGGEASAPAEAEIARRAGRAGDGRRRRHRAGDRRAPHGRGRLRRARRHRRPEPRCDRRRLRQAVRQGRGRRSSRRRDERACGRGGVPRGRSRLRRASILSSPTPASPPPRRSRTPRSTFGTATSRSSPPDIFSPRGRATGS